MTNGTFRRIVTLNDDLNLQITDITHKFFSSVKLPPFVEKLGGITWLDTIVSLTLERMTLSNKLDVILRGHQALMALTDRFVHLWLTNASPQERLLLDRKLKEHHISY
jgi:hypothetical protein